MENFERDWTAVGQRAVAYYTNLPPGQYRFHVVAYEMNAPQNATEAVLAIQLRPHLYQTRWFIALCGLIVAAAAWGAYRLHVRNIRRQFAAVLEERNRLAREMHDTLIQGCVGVSTLLEAASHAQEVSPELGHDLLDRARAEVRAAVEEATAGGLEPAARFVEWRPPRARGVPARPSHRPRRRHRRQRRGVRHPRCRRR
jgi:signal transduction histidine kinase